MGTAVAPLWVRADSAHEVDGAVMWVAPLPHGPVVRLEGAALVLLEQFATMTTVHQAVDDCVEAVDGAPADAQTQLTALADDFIATGLLESVPHSDVSAPRKDT